MKKQHGGKWLIVDVKGRKWEPKGSSKVRAAKGPFYIGSCALLYKLEYLKGPFFITSPLVIDISCIIIGGFLHITIFDHVSYMHLTYDQ